MKLKSLASLLVLFAAGFGIYWFMNGTRKVPDQPSAANAAILTAFIRHSVPKDIAAFSFSDGAGASLDLSHWKGKVVLLNLWATWCAPCRKEMPELAKLQQDLGSSDFEVVALSEDLKGAEASAAFLKDAKAEALALYVDPKATALEAVQSLGLPTTLLIDRDGKEVGRLLGPAQWNSEESKTLIKSVLAQK
jgi:thiol-disulfide isomerase/thioredoxin